MWEPLCVCVCPWWCYYVDCFVLSDCLIYYHYSCIWFCLNVHVLCLRTTRWCISRWNKINPLLLSRCTLIRAEPRLHFIGPWHYHNWLIKLMLLSSCFSSIFFIKHFSAVQSCNRPFFLKDLHWCVQTMCQQHTQNAFSWSLEMACESCRRRKGMHSFSLSHHPGVVKHMSSEVSPYPGI